MTVATAMPHMANERSRALAKFPEVPRNPSSSCYQVSQAMLDSSSSGTLRDGKFLVSRSRWISPFARLTSYRGIKFALGANMQSIFLAWATLPCRALRRRLLRQRQPRSRLFQETLPCPRLPRRRLRWTLVAGTALLYHWPLRGGSHRCYALAEWLWLPHAASKCSFPKSHEPAAHSCLRRQIGRGHRQQRQTLRGIGCF